MNWLQQRKVWGLHRPAAAVPPYRAGPLASATEPGESPVPALAGGRSVGHPLLDDTASEVCIDQSPFSACNRLTQRGIIDPLVSNKAREAFGLVDLHRCPCAHVLCITHCAINKSAFSSLAAWALQRLTTSRKASLEVAPAV
jgi:hypothetical protein